jgi:hypothetical protein
MLRQLNRLQSFFVVLSLFDIVFFSLFFVYVRFQVAPLVTSSSPISSVLMALGHHKAEHIMAAADIIREHCLFNLDLSHKYNGSKRADYFEKGAVAALVKAMDVNREHPGIQEKACLALCTFDLKDVSNQVCFCFC